MERRTGVDDDWGAAEAKVAMVAWVGVAHGVELTDSCHGQDRAKWSIRLLCLACQPKAYF